MAFFDRSVDAAWIARFHAGDRNTLERCYRDHVAEVLKAAARILSGVEAETVTHEVFFRLLSDEQMRKAFTGGNFGAWVARVTTNAAIDHHRRRRREVDEAPGGACDTPSPHTDDELDARRLVERFCRERLPEKWLAVFEARFLRQLSQQEAARELRMQRTTLAYQEQQIRALLTEFVLDAEAS